MIARRITAAFAALAVSAVMITALPLTANADEMFIGSVTTPEYIEAEGDTYVIDYIKKSSDAEILSNTELGDEDLSFLRESVEKYTIMIEKNGFKSVLESVVKRGNAE